MVNKVTLIGHLGRDPEVRRLENGAVVAKFSVATNENYKDKNDEWQKLTEWHDVVAWRSLAEQAEKYLKKGSLVYVEGKLTHRKWQDANGIDRWSTEVVANSLRSLEKREGTSGFPSATDEPASSQRNTGGTDNTVYADIPANNGSTGDDLPF